MAMEKHLTIIKDLIVSALQPPELHYLIPALESGKMLRPLLCLQTAEAFDTPITTRTHLLAAALECIHLASLLHDDVIDHSALRRKNASIWHKHGVPAAILGGDYLLAHSLILASRAGDTHAIEVVARKTKQVIHGEILQNHATLTPWSKAAYTRIITLKTASLFEAAILLFAPQEHRAHLARTGTWMGVAFQILNDLKDYAFLWEDTPPGSDVTERRMSAPFLWFMHNSPNAAALLELWKSPQLAPLTEALLKEEKNSMLQKIYAVISALATKSCGTFHALKIPNAQALASFCTTTLLHPLRHFHALHARTTLT